MNVLNSTVQMAKSVLRIKDRPKLRDWEKMFGSEQPQIIALVGLARGGSHFVIDQFHKHPNLMGLSERVPDDYKIKRFFIGGDYNLASLKEEQLLPKKEISGDIKYLITNKLGLEQTVYYQPVWGPKLIHMYCFRNPFGVYLSWCKGWEKFAERNCDSIIDQSWVDRWYESTLISSLTRYALFWDEKKDLAVNLEVIVVHKQEGLDYILKKLGLPLYDEVKLVELTACPTCGEKLIAKNCESGNKYQQKALFCQKCNDYIFGPGGYNYIREMDATGLGEWKENPKATKIMESLSGFLGKEMVGYYYDEEYLSDRDGSMFFNKFKELMGRLSYRIRRD